MRTTILILSTVLLAGCITRKTAETADTLLTTAAASTVGYVASDGNAAVAAGAGLTALAAKQYASNIRDKKQREEIAKAYAAGEAKATRDLYEAIQHNQAVDTEKPTNTEPDDATALPITAPRRVVNGVIIEPSVEYIRVHDTQ